MNFLRSRTATHTLTTRGSPVPKVVLPDPILMDIDVGVRMDQQEDCEDEDNDEDAMEDESDENAVGDESDDDSEGDSKYIGHDATVLSDTIFPCTIRYMDLTCLDLQHFRRVSQVLLIRDEWDEVVDIFNKRDPRIQGSALLTGQPGTGKYYYGPWISVCKLISP